MSSVFALPRAIRRHNNNETSYKQDTIILRRVANNKTRNAIELLKSSALQATLVWGEWSPESKLYLLLQPLLFQCAVSCLHNFAGINISQTQWPIKSLILIQVPARILEWAVHYNNASDQAEIFSLILGILFDLPLIINPLGVIILRGNGTINLRKRLSETELDHPLVSSPSEDNLTMIVAMDQQELENALFAAKTTSLWFHMKLVARFSTKNWIDLF